MTNRSQEVFDTTASTYDQDRAKLIPGCDSFYRWTLDLIPKRAKRILELGAGSGLLTRMVRDRFPEAEIWGIDFSAPMLELARQRMGEDSGMTYLQADYVQAAWPQGMCAVVSSLSIHHLDDEGKKTVFAKAAEVLKPGGVFVNGDQVLGPTAALEERYKALWLEQVRVAGATEEQIEASLYRQREDRCVSVEEQMGWMRAAGLADVDCWWKEGRFAVTCGAAGDALRA